MSDTFGAGPALGRGVNWLGVRNSKVGDTLNLLALEGWGVEGEAWWEGEDKLLGNGPPKKKSVPRALSFCSGPASEIWICHEYKIVTITYLNKENVPNHSNFPSSSAYFARSRTFAVYIPPDSTSIKCAHCLLWRQKKKFSTSSMRL